MKKGNYIEAILRSKQTIFSFKDIVMLWRNTGDNTVRVRIDYYVRNGKLLRLRRGVYAKSKDYDPLELATKIFAPSYVSFETVLAMEGVIFQYYETIFAVSYLTREIKCGGKNYSFRKIKKTILTNRMGLENKEGYSIATKERAFLDTIYTNKDYYFDNLRSIDWEKVQEMLPMYENQRMTRKVKEMFEYFKSDQ